MQYHPASIILTATGGDVAVDVQRSLSGPGPNSTASGGSGTGTPGWHAGIVTICQPERSARMDNPRQPPGPSLVCASAERVQPEAAVQQTASASLSVL
jgi:hypothetical protein